MAEINLLTKRLAPAGSVVKMAKGMKIFAVFGTALFFVAIIIMVAIFVTDSTLLTKSINNQEALKKSIKAMETTEIEYTVVKDRVSSIKTIFDAGNVIDDMENLLSLTNTIPKETEFSNAEISKKNTKFSFSSPSSKNLVETFAIIVSTDRYKTIVLETFSYNPGKGYVIELNMSGS